MLKELIPVNYAMCVLFFYFIFLYQSEGLTLYGYSSLGDINVLATQAV